jgi:hypothetical protein
MLTIVYISMAHESHYLFLALTLINFVNRKEAKWKTQYNFWP